MSFFLNSFVLKIPPSFLWTNLLGRRLEWGWYTVESPGLYSDWDDEAWQFLVSSSTDATLISYSSGKLPNFFWQLSISIKILEWRPKKTSSLTCGQIIEFQNDLPLKIFTINNTVTSEEPGCVVRKHSGTSWWVLYFFNRHLFCYPSSFHNGSINLTALSNVTKYISLGLT